ncbi:MAG: hypothetical protein KBC98_01585 [Candidatus Pacebacteria bacterium]|nr:hypothetical protein [Candidatus Paceibacterota bacterium]
MKKFIGIMIACLGIIFSTHAQTDSVKKFQMDYHYAGLLVNGNFSTQKWGVNPGASVRVGGGASYYPNKKVRIQSWAFADYDGTALARNIMFGVHYTPFKGFIVSVGQIPSLTATMRPVPATAWGHFEPWTSAQLTGLAPGVTVRYSFKKNDVGIGGCYRLKHPEVHGRVKLGSLLMVGYYNQSGRWGASAGITRDKFSLKVIMTDSLYGALSVITLYGKENLFAYIDMGANKKIFSNGETEKAIVRAECGIFWSFDKKPLGGLIGIGYSHEIRAVKTYFFFYLE